MALRWNPWNIDRFLEDDWDLPTIPGLSRLAGQGLNIYETEDKVVAEASLPGVPEDKIDVTIDEGVVRINGFHEDTEEERKKRRYFMSSMVRNFNYSFRLPQNVVTDKEPEVECENGVVRMVFDKVQKKAPKKIRVIARKKAESPQKGK